MKVSISRRDFLKASALTVVAAAVQACAQPTPTVAPTKPAAAPTATTKPAEPTKPAAAAPTNTAVPAAATKPPAAATVAPTVAPTKPPAVTYKEAPMLAALVKAGKLPAVDQRLPIEPKVFKGMEGIGKYGGVMRRCFSGVSDATGPSKHRDRTLTWFDGKFNIEPRIAKSWTVNANGSEWTFNLRKGMKWSDGAPFTSADFVFWMNDERLVKEINSSASPGSNFVTGTKNTPAKVTAPDDYTVKFTFADPKPLFLIAIGRATYFTPAHYMKKYHIKYATDQAAFEKQWKDAKATDWGAYYNTMNTWWRPPRPDVGGWIPTNLLSEEIFTMERNPYFFGVDEQGQQLPYIDKVTHRLYSTADVKNMWVINGEIDFQARSMAFSDYTLFKQNEKKGDYQVFLGISGSHTALNTNHTCKDPKIRELFQNLDVRKAISHAVNRDELNEIMFEGMATPRQYSPISRSAQFYKKLSDAYIKYDVKTANDLLDKAGYSKKGADGMRLWKDGSGPVSFIIEGTDQTGTPAEDAILMVVKYLAAVGLKATYKYAERSLYTQHYNANDIESAWWGGDRSVVPLVAPWIWLGRQTDRPWCNAWYWGAADPTNANAEQAPADHWVRKIWDLWDNGAAVQTDSAKQNEYFFKILDIWVEQLPYPCFLGEQPVPIIVKNGFKGYPNDQALDDPVGDEHLFNTETYYWDDPSKHGG